MTIEEKEILLISKAAELLQLALNHADATGDKSQNRRAGLLHDNQGLVPSLMITCGHGGLDKIALELNFTDPTTGHHRVRLLALHAAQETVQ